MAKNKQKKLKERERRVAKKKLVEAAKRREAQPEGENQNSTAGKKVFTPAKVAKPDYVPSNKKSPFTQRRSGGG